MGMPTEVGAWRIVGRLGGGDFGTVYEVVQDRADGELRGAMKLGDPENEDQRIRLDIEADALRQLDHPSIPKLLEYDASGARPMLVMSLAPGKDMLSIFKAWEPRDRVFGSRETIEILAQCLSAMEHVHGRELVHRDIKEANVIVDLESLKATVIDFGFCKKAGVSTIRLTDSYWRAGASRFAPPSKLADPSLALAAHDVFAFGVLAYLMLTGVLPWPVPANQGLGALRALLRDHVPNPAGDVNSVVDSDLSRLVTRLLTLDDDSRPAATQALDELREIQARIARRGRRSSARRLIFEHVVRDSVHGDVWLTDLEYRALNSREMQRLRWVRQLGLTNLVYPTADHSRLSHSIGVVNRTEAIFRAVEETTGVFIDSDTRQIARLYGLTHDLCHIPLGHTIEDELGLLVRHDMNRGRFERFTSGSTELGLLLDESEVARAVRDLLSPERTAQHETLVDQVVSGIVGADVLDYVDRDAWHCGLDHRVDSALLRQVSFHEHALSSVRRVVVKEGGRYGLRVDKQYSVESLLAERYALFLKVYTHSAKVAADALLGKALYEYAPRGAKDEQFDWLGDETLLATLAASKRGMVASYADQLKYRHLPRAVFRANVLGQLERSQRHYDDRLGVLEGRGYLSPRGRATLEAEIAKEAGLQAQDVFFYCPRKAPGYRRAEHWVSSDILGSPRHTVASNGGDIAARHLGCGKPGYLFRKKPTGLSEHQWLRSLRTSLAGLACQTLSRNRGGHLFFDFAISCQLCNHYHDMTVVTQAVVAAGGQGRRMGYRWGGGPKAMMSLNGDPALSLTLRGMRVAGITQIVVMSDEPEIARKARVIAEHCGFAGSACRIIIDRGVGVCGLPVVAERLLSDGFLFDAGHSALPASEYRRLITAVRCGKRSDVIAFANDAMTSNGSRFIVDIGDVATCDATATAIPSMVCVGLPLVLGRCHLQEIIDAGYRFDMFFRSLISNGHLQVCLSGWPLEFDTPSEYERVSALITRHAA